MKIIIEIEGSELNNEVLNCLKMMSENVQEKMQKKRANIDTKQKQEKPKDEQKQEEKNEIKEKKPLTFEEVKSGAIMLKEKKGKEVIKQILGLFGASKLQEIKEEDYENFIKAVEEAL